MPYRIRIMAFVADMTGGNTVLLAIAAAHQTILWYPTRRSLIPTQSSRAACW